MKFSYCTIVFSFMERFLHFPSKHLPTSKHKQLEVYFQNNILGGRLCEKGARPAETSQQPKYHQTQKIQPFTFHLDLSPRIFTRGRSLWWRYKSSFSVLDSRKCVFLALHSGNKKINYILVSTRERLIKKCSVCTERSSSSSHFEHSAQVPGGCT